jgi:hypothetical protein
MEIFGKINVSIVHLVSYFSLDNAVESVELTKSMQILSVYVPMDLLDKAKTVSILLPKLVEQIKFTVNLQKIVPVHKDAMIPITI